MPEGAGSLTGQNFKRHYVLCSPYNLSLWISQFFFKNCASVFWKNIEPGPVGTLTRLNTLVR